MGVASRGVAVSIERVCSMSNRLGHLTTPNLERTASNAAKITLSRTRILQNVQPFEPLYADGGQNRCKQIVGCCEPPKLMTAERMQRLATGPREIGADGTIGKRLAIASIRLTRLTAGPITVKSSRLAAPILP